jgi:hypothetical protein
LASGDRGTRIPARGNTDAIGQIARSLDKWIDDLVEADMVGRELEQTRAKLELTAAEAERKVQAAAEQAAAAIRAELETPDPVPEQPIEPPRPEPISAPQEQRGIPAPLETLSGAGPISSISQQLTHFSEYVTAAAHDVERTEALIRSLSDSTSHIEVLGNLVTAIRDQVNLLAFRTSPRDYVATDRENLIPFNNDERQGMSDPVTAGRLDSIRESTDRAERTLQSVRASMDNVTAIAQDIASTASGQALEATNKLLSQSQYLQNMLDDIMTRIHPPATNRLAPPAPEQNPADRPWTGVPPRKA